MEATVFGIIRNSTNILLLDTVEHNATMVALNFIERNMLKRNKISDTEFETIKSLHHNTILARFRQYFGFTFRIAKLEIKEIYGN